jgi:hypothetical protein
MGHLDRIAAVRKSLGGHQASSRWQRVYSRSIAVISGHAQPLIFRDPSIRGSDVGEPKHCLPGATIGNDRNLEPRRHPDPDRCCKLSCCQYGTTDIDLHRSGGQKKFRAVQTDPSTQGGEREPER